MRTTSRPAAAAGLALLAGFLAAGCGGGDAPADQPSATPSEDTPDRGGTAIMAEMADMSKPHPVVFERALDADLADVMYMSVLRGDWTGDRMELLTAERSPMAMAWHWDFVGPDSTDVRFHLKSGLRWSDGEPLTAHDAKFTYDLIRNPETASPRFTDFEAVDSVSVENDTTLVVHYARRYADMLFVASTPVAPRHVYEGTAPAEIRRHEALVRPAEKLVVSGAFRVGEWQPDQQITLVPNPHFSVQPHLERIVIRVIPDPATRALELRSARVDFARPLSFEQIPALRQEAPFLRFEKEEQRFWEFLAWNQTKVPAFRDPRVRRALGLAIDAPGIIRDLQMGEYATPAAGPYSPIMADLADPERVRPLPFDTAQARRLLDEAGWMDRDGDGIREKDGQPLRFTLETNTGNQRRADVSTLVQRQLRNVGVDVRLRPLELNVFFDRLYGREHEAALGGFGVQLNPDLAGAWQPGSTFNVVGHEDPELLRVMETARAQPTAELALPYWKEAAARIVAADAYRFLYYYDVVSGVNERLKGMEVDSYGAYQNTWEWWIPQELQGGPGAVRAQR